MPFAVFTEGLDGGGGGGVWYSLFINKFADYSPHNFFAYSLKSIPLFIKTLSYICLVIKYKVPHWLFPTLVPGLRPLGWFFTYLVTKSLNDNKHTALMSNNLTKHTTGRCYFMINYRKRPFVFLVRGHVLTIQYLFFAILYRVIINNYTRKTDMIK